MDLSSDAERYLDGGFDHDNLGEMEEEPSLPAATPWPANHAPASEVFVVDDDFAQTTKLRSAANDLYVRLLAPTRKGANISTTKMLAGREANVSGRGRFSRADSCHVLGRYLPTEDPWLIDKSKSKAYVSQFSADGTLFVAGFRNGQITIYDAQNGWKVQKDILAENLRWTITDASLSPDQRFLAYSSMSPIVHIVSAGSRHARGRSIANVTEIHEGLDFTNSEIGEDEFGIFCVKFSNDGRELVAGSNDSSIYIFDLVANKLSLAISAHTDDVNVVSFADETGHIMYSGSDDSFCKVWDRRCINSRGRESGVLVGHLEGITFLDSRGDGRYLISNGKDQCIKLWDIRKMSSSTSPSDRRAYHMNWDYRWMEYPEYKKNKKHPNDQSLATFRGHKVLCTLIRCYFSPAFSTGQRYIYTGSHDGCIYIFDVLTGEFARKLVYHSSTVRDCSWHPIFPTLVTSSWDGEIACWGVENGNHAKTLGLKKVRRRKGFHGRSHSN